MRFALYAQHGRYQYGESPERGLASAFRTNGKGVRREADEIGEFQWNSPLPEP